MKLVKGGQRQGYPTPLSQIIFSSTGFEEMIQNSAGWIHSVLAKIKQTQEEKVQKAQVVDETQKDQEMGEIQKDYQVAEIKRVLKESENIQRESESQEAARGQKVAKGQKAVRGQGAVKGQETKDQNGARGQEGTKARNAGSQRQRGKKRGQQGQETNGKKMIKMDSPEESFPRQDSEENLPGSLSQLIRFCELAGPGPSTIGEGDFN